MPDVVRILAYAESDTSQEDVSLSDKGSLDAINHADTGAVKIQFPTHIVSHPVATSITHWSFKLLVQVRMYCKLLADVDILHGLVMLKHCIITFMKQQKIVQNQWIFYYNKRISHVGTFKAM